MCSVFVMGETVMAKVKLRTLPVEIDPEAIALGMLEMFSEDERVVLRFGMLPADKMEVLEKAIERRFREVSTNPTGTADKCLALMNEPHPRCIEFSMRELVREAMHLITLQFYEHGELVV